MLKQNKRSNGAGNSCEWKIDFVHICNCVYYYLNYVIFGKAIRYKMEMALVACHAGLTTRNK
jgi:hypothetical protein